MLKYFSKKISELNGINEAKFDSDLDLFYTYEWPGNVRELRNVVERLIILSETSFITKEDIEKYSGK